MIDGKASRKRGYSQVSHDILEQLACRRLSGTEMRLLVLLIRETYGYQQHTCRATVKELAEVLGASRDGVSRALAKLASDKIVKKDGEELGINPFFSDWTREVIGKKPEPKTARPHRQKRGVKRKKGTAKDILNRVLGPV